MIQNLATQPKIYIGIQSTKIFQACNISNFATSEYTNFRYHRIHNFCIIFSVRQKVLHTSGAMASKTSNAPNDAAKVAALTEEVPHGQR